MNLVKHIPNAITCGNLLCGCLGIIEVFNGRLTNASLLMLVAGILDFFDGFVARLLHVQSPIGKELDSLADMVTFGALPGFIMYYLIGYYSNFGVFATNNWCYVALLIPIFSALRLAKFNIDTRQSDQFIGVPTPANAIFLGSFPFLFQTPLFAHLLIGHPSLVMAILVVICIVCSLMLVAPLPLIALKFKNFTWKDNKARFSLIGIGALLLIFLQTLALPLIIILYVLFSMVVFWRNKKVGNI